MNFIATVLCIAALLGLLSASRYRASPPAQDPMDPALERRLRALLLDNSSVDPADALVISEAAEPKGSTISRVFRLPETVARIVVRDLVFVKDKLRVFQQAHHWLTPGGTLRVVPYRAPQSKGDARVTTHTYPTHYTERLSYRGRTAHTSRPIYPEEDTTLLDMAHSAGFARVGAWTFRKA